MENTKFKVKLQWIPQSPGVQTLTVNATNEDEAQETAASMASHIFETNNEQGFWQITDVETEPIYNMGETPSYYTSFGDYDGDITSYTIDASTWGKAAWNKSSEYIPYSVVSDASLDELPAGDSDMDYTPYASAPTTEGSESNEGAYRPYADPVSGAYRPYAGSPGNIEGEPIDGNETEPYTPYSSVVASAVAAPAMNDQEGISASEAAGYTSYFPGARTSGSASGPNKAYYAELRNGYAPYRAFRLTAKKGQKIIV